MPCSKPDSKFRRPFQTKAQRNAHNLTNPNLYLPRERKVKAKYTHTSRLLRTAPTSPCVSLCGCRATKHASQANSAKHLARRPSLYPRGQKVHVAGSFLLSFRQPPKNRLLDANNQLLHEHARSLRDPHCNPLHVFRSRPLSAIRLSFAALFYHVMLSTGSGNAKTTHPMWFPLEAIQHPERRHCPVFARMKQLTPFGRYGKTRASLGSTVLQLRGAWFGSLNCGLEVHGH